MKTEVKVTNRKNKKKAPIHQYGNFYKGDGHNQLYQLIRMDDVPEGGTQINLIAHPEAETALSVPLVVKDSFNITEEELAELCSALGENLELVKNVTITFCRLPKVAIRSSNFQFKTNYDTRNLL